MFHKPFRVKTQTAIKGSDRKKLRADVGKLFPSLNADDLNVIIPAKEDMTVAKAYLHSGGNAFIYCLLKNPIFFEVDKQLFPTVYCMWKFPDLLPVVPTWEGVFDKLVGGADLMAPGVCKGAISPAMFGSVQPGDLCAITLVGNRAPIAVGTAVLSGEEMLEADKKGKGVHVVHIKNDYLWRFGDKSEPPVLQDVSNAGILAEEEEARAAGIADGTEICVPDEAFGVGEMTLEDNQSEAETSGCDRVDNEDSAVECPEETGEDETEAVDPIQEMDDLLQFCFKCAVKAQLKKSDLPLLTSQFFKLHMVPYCPAGKSLDVKKSSFKKLSKFLQEMEKQEFIKVKELSKGADSIVEVNKSHLQLRSLEVPEIEAASGGAGAAASVVEEEICPVQIVEKLSITAAVMPVFKNQEYSKGSTVLPSEVRKLITDYVQENNLKDETDRSMVKLDPILADIVLNKNDGDMTHLKWEELFSRFVDKMSLAYEVHSSGEPPTVYKGKVKPIKIDVVMRGSNKKVTLVDNLELFKIDPETFAKAVQKGVACSATIGHVPQKNQGVQVLIQGNQVAYVGSLLLDKYKVARKYIIGLEKAPKNKRR